MDDQREYIYILYKVPVLNNRDICVYSEMMPGTLDNPSQPRTITLMSRSVVHPLCPSVRMPRGYPGGGACGMRHAAFFLVPQLSSRVCCFLLGHQVKSCVRAKINIGYTNFEEVEKDGRKQTKITAVRVPRALASASAGAGGGRYMLP